MPQVQFLQYREIGAKGQEALAQMAKALADMPEPQGGVGRLHIEGVTVGDNPFAPDVREFLRARGYKLDSVNWLYYKRFDDDSEALDEMEVLGRYRDGLPNASNVHVRVMQDPVLDESWGNVEAY